MPVMFCVPRSLCLGVFLAGSVALWGQNPVVPEGGEFSILGSMPGDQVWPSVWAIEPDGTVFWTEDAAGCSSARAAFVMLCTGTTERPMPSLDGHCQA